MAMSRQTASRSCVSCYSYDDTKKATLTTPCCGRFVCGTCARRNPRLAETCILCQLPIPQDLSQAVGEDLPNYDESLPTYDSTKDFYQGSYGNEKEKLPNSNPYKELGVQHYVRKDDSIASLALAYKVDPSVIRKANHIFQDNLLQGRSFIVVPGATVSLSASPDEHEERKVKLKKFMVAVKCTDYDMAKSKCTPARNKPVFDHLSVYDRV